jgi:tellurite methyltransferase
MADGDKQRWNAKWAETAAGTAHGSSMVRLVEPWLPSHGNALDVAGGGSLDSLEFARRGFAVTVVDVAEEGLALARRAAADAQLEIQTIAADLDAAPLPAGDWDVITISNYFDPGVITSAASSVSPGGVLALVIATITNLERHDRPGRRFLVERDQITSLVQGELEVVHHSEAWRDNGRHEAHLVAVHNRGGEST